MQAPASVNTSHPVHPAFASIVLAAQTTTLDKLRHIPPHTWLNCAIFVVGVVVVFKVWRTLRNINEYAPYIAITVASVSVFFYWVFTRTEPEFLTPVVERLTPFFPTQTVQKENIEKARQLRPH